MCNVLVLHCTLWLNCGTSLANSVKLNTNPSHLPYLSPSCPVQCRRSSSIKHFHLDRSCASFSVILRDWRSFLMVAFRQCLEWPRFLISLAFISYTLLMSSSYSSQHTWSNHPRCWLFIKSLTDITFASFLMSSFLRCSSRLILKEYLTIRISHVLLLLAKCSVTGYVLLPYSRVGHMAFW